MRHALHAPRAVNVRLCAAQIEDAFGLRLWSEIEQNIAATLSRFASPLRPLIRRCAWSLSAEGRADHIGAVRRSIAGIDLDFFFDPFGRLAVKIAGFGLFPDATPGKGSNVPIDHIATRYRPRSPRLRAASWSSLDQNGLIAPQLEGAVDLARHALTNIQKAFAMRPPVRRFDIRKRRIETDGIARILGSLLQKFAERRIVLVKTLDLLGLAPRVEALGADGGSPPAPARAGAAGTLNDAREDLVALQDDADIQPLHVEPDLAAGIVDREGAAIACCAALSVTLISTRYGRRMPVRSLPPICTSQGTDQTASLERS